MKRIRAYTDADFESIKTIHARQSAPYEFPDLRNPLFVSKLILEEDGELAAAAFLRITAEGYLLLNRAIEVPPGVRWRHLLLLHEAVRGVAAQRGFDDVHCWLPPNVEPSFGKRLRQLGWTPEKWNCYSRSVLGTTPGI